MNTSLRKAAQMALEALEYDTRPETEYGINVAIEALRAALAQPEPEPVVWMYQDKSTHEVKFQKHMRDFVDHGATYEVPLYTAKPQREWQGMTTDEIYTVWDHRTGAPVDFARAIEAKLKEKNA